MKGKEMSKEVENTARSNETVVLSLHDENVHMVCGYGAGGARDGQSTGIANNPGMVFDVIDHKLLRAEPDGSVSWGDEAMEDKNLISHYLIFPDLEAAQSVARRMYAHFVLNEGTDQR